MLWPFLMPFTSAVASSLYPWPQWSRRHVSNFQSAYQTQLLNSQLSFWLHSIQHCSQLATPSNVFWPALWVATLTVRLRVVDSSQKSWKGASKYRLLLKSIPEWCVVCACSTAHSQAQVQVNKSWQTHCQRPSMLRWRANNESCF